MNKITETKLKKYFSITKKALSKATIHKDYKTEATKLLAMAQRYYDDAKYFYKEKNDLVTAFAALNYAHGWLDAGAHLGYFDVDDDQLFVLKDE
ncbi:hypothetical protein CL622_08715 [archaeon]|nr:hypothetical protein [archaeon]|tara:strand:- start:1235 stop:1516 length:282 start_codon:yes stop_codon:yes gene_type:complete